MAIFVTLLMGLVIAGFLWIGFFHWKEVRNNQSLLRGSITRKGNRKRRPAKRASIRK
jgi:hypothetical protein